MKKILINKSSLRKAPAFSLGETMIVLVIAAILMGVTAPLIAKKTTMNTKRIAVQGYDNNHNPTVNAAVGKNQTFTVGNGEGDMKVAGNTLIRKFLTSANANNGKKFIIAYNADSGSNFKIKMRNNNFPATDVFSIDNTGQTNLLAPVPDYTKMYKITGTVAHLNRDGFLYVPTGSNVYVSSLTSGGTLQSSVIENTYELNMKIDLTNESSIWASVPILIPVSSGSYIRSTNINTVFYFIPLARAKTKIIEP